MKFNINSNTFVNINRLLRTYILNNRKHSTQFVKATAAHSWDSKNINLLTNTQGTIKIYVRMFWGFFEPPT